MITKANKEYTNNIDRWEFYFQSYVGGPDYTENTENLFRHRLESPTDYNNRIKRAYFLNYCGPMVDIYANHLFQPEITRELSGKDFGFEEFKKNVDRQRHDIDKFMKDAARYALIYGKVYILIDVPQTTSKVETRQDEIDSGLIPYFTIYTPQNVIDWDYDRDGNLNWIKFQEPFEGNPSWEEGSNISATSYIYRIFTKTEWILEKEETNKDSGKSEPVVIARGAHNLGIVPVVLLDFGKSLLSDIAYINRDIFNCCSLLDEGLYRQTFSQLTIMVNDEDTSAEKVKKTGLNTAITYAQGLERPGFIAPTTEPGQMLLEKIGWSINEIYRLAHVNSVPTEKREFYGSGQSKRWTFDDLNNALADLGAELEMTELQMWSLWFKWQNEDGEVAPEYAKDYAVGSLSQDIEDIIQGSIAKLPPLALSKLREKASGKLLSDLSEADNIAIKEQCKEQMERDAKMLDRMAEDPQLVKGSELVNGNQPRNNKGNYTDPNQ